MTARYWTPLPRYSVDVRDADAPDVLYRAIVFAFSEATAHALACAKYSTSKRGAHGMLSAHTVFVTEPRAD